MKLNKGQIVGLVGGIIALVGFFLPWATVTGTMGGVETTITVMGYYAFIPLIFSILTIAFAAALKKPVGGILTMVMALIGLLITLWNLMGIEAIKMMYSDYGDVTVTTGIGIYITMVGFVIAIVGGILHFVFAKKESQQTS